VGYVLKRVLVTIPTLFGVSLVIFFMVRLLPGDVIDVLLGGDQAATAAMKQQARERLGLTGSYPEQYWRWASHFVQGDFGFSYRNTQAVSEILGHAVPITLELVILGLLIAVLVCAAILHTLHGWWDVGALVVYAAATWAVMAGRMQWAAAN